MIRAFVHDAGTLRPLSWPTTLAGALWIDLRDPSPEDLLAVGAEIGTELPTRAEMEEIEVSSRIYQENGTAYLTIVLPVRSEEATRSVGPVTFVLRPERLISIRYCDSKPFETYPAHAVRVPAGCASARAVLHGLIEEIIDRLADILEQVGAAIESLSRDIFRPAPGHRRNRDLQSVLEGIGREGDLVADTRFALLSVERVLSFLRLAEPGELPDASGREIKAMQKSQVGDVHALVEHAGFLAQKITHLLDATLGMISIEQNATIKIFSVLAVIFMPPTLIASIYGMNFEVMPELALPFGYPLALALMVCSAGITYYIFKRSGWM